MRATMIILTILAVLNTKTSIASDIRSTPLYQSCEKNPYDTGGLLGLRKGEKKRLRVECTVVFERARALEEEAAQRREFENRTKEWLKEAKGRLLRSPAPTYQQTNPLQQRVEELERRVEELENR